MEKSCAYKKDKIYEEAVVCVPFPKADIYIPKVKQNWKIMGGINGRALVWVMGHLVRGWIIGPKLLMHSTHSTNWPIKTKKDASLMTYQSSQTNTHY